MAFRQTLLLIEDDAQIRRFLRQSMENEGFDVREAITLADGLVDAGTARPDLVVLISRYRMATASSLSMSVMGRRCRCWCSARSAEAKKLPPLRQAPMTI